ncbi:hypothetical protein FA15DRAFT_664885 [Coprinopsis marcescibilis]|uniref:Dicer-like protein 1 n=1 Tax=Coprinopsis marcescibilis TaxID=230819 RepID=A0A5C3L7U1_COPMA|nr:hypothetical protein FA15DRAFT_664885 [Coprinopsis marcescibilis]
MASQSSSRKRPRSYNQEANNEPLHKQPKSANRDLLRHHLPEGQFENLPTLEGSELRESILEVAKHSNTIAYLPKLSCVDTICYDFLRWHLDSTNEESPSELARRVAVFVVEKEASLDAHALYIRKSIPHRTCFCSTSMNKTKRELLEFDVLVVTSQQLLELFSKRVLRLKHVSTLVIEDAQHIKNHDCYSFLPLVQFMKTFYSASIITTPLPRVFSFAVHTNNTLNQGFDSQLLKLEVTLHSKIYGVSDTKRNEILKLPDAPTETVVLFDRPEAEANQVISLYAELQGVDSSEQVIGKQLREAGHVATQLGLCATDLFLRKELRHFGRNLPEWSADMDESDPAEASRLKIRDTIKNWTFSMPNLDPSSKGFNVTPKFLRLVQVLEACSEYGEALRCIIFMQRRSTAYALTEMLRGTNERLMLIRPFVVTGQLGFEEQRQVFTQFASGFFNVAVATYSIAELDTPKATAVIRFDQMASQILYGHVRACTRGRESSLINLVERSNDSQRHILADSSGCTEELLGWMNTLRDSDIITVPPENLKESLQCYQSDAEDDAATAEYIYDATLGGRVYPQDATVVLLKYVSHLRAQGAVPPNHPLFEFDTKRSKSESTPRYVCTVSLPGAPIDGVSGSAEQMKQMARRSVAFAACKKLSSLGLLDFNFIPLPVTLPPKKTASGETQATGTQRYPRKSPEFWKSCNTGAISRLYPAVLQVEGEVRTHAPLLLLTRKPLPALSPFTLFVAGKRTLIRFSKAAPFDLDRDQANFIYAFTLRLFKMSLNKMLSCPLEEVTFFLAPLSKTWREMPPTTEFELPNVFDEINWDLVSTAAENWATSIDMDRSSALEKDLEDAVIQDRWVEFTRRYHVTAVRRDLTPLSKPDDCLLGDKYESLLSFVVEKKRDFEGLKTPQQPVIEVDKVPPVLNNLNPRNKDHTLAVKGVQKYLIPELCAKCTIPGSILRTVLLAPSIISKVDDLLVVKELNMRFFNNSIREDLLYIAITTVSAEMEHDYERLEVLGDAFLKYLASLVVFIMNPTQNEGSLHVARQKLISNKSLHAYSTDIGLPAYVRSKPFNMKAWRPWPTTSFNAKNMPTQDKGSDVDELAENTAAGKSAASEESGAALDVGEPTPQRDESTPKAEGDEGEAGKQTKGRKRGRGKPKGDDKNTQILGDKAVADVAEAIIGAAYISGGRECALTTVKALYIPLPGINAWSDLGGKLTIPFAAQELELAPGSIQAIEGIIGHRFKYPQLLVQVLTHASTHSNEGLSYERLEFIGDAILDFMVIRHIFDRESSLSPGGLTLLKSAMVANSTLAALCILSGIHQHVIFGSYHLSKSMGEYAESISRKAEEEYTLAEKEDRPPGQFWTDVEPPKALSDIIESIIGALYISDDFSPVGIEAFFDNVLRPFFDKHITLQTLTHHPTKTLFEVVQSYGCQMLKFTKDNKPKEGLTMCQISIHDTELASASDRFPTMAARKASVLALAKVRSESEIFVRVCDCRASGKRKGGVLGKGFEHALSALEQAGDKV